MSQSLAISVGTRVRVTQQLPRGAETAWSSAIEGAVLRARQAETGSWFAHSRNDRLWLDRLEIQKDDGEITTSNLDQFSVVEILENAS